MRTPTIFLFLALAVSAYGAASTLPERLDLDSAISIALENNFAIRQSRERIRAQDGVITTVRAAGLPNVSSDASYQRSEIATIQTSSGGPIIFVPQGPSWRMSFTGSQSLFSGGGVQAAVRGAVLTREAAVLELQSVVNDSLLDVRIRFYDALLARERVKVQEQNLELLQGQLGHATSRARVGTISDFERLRAEVAVANAKAPLIRAENDFRLAMEELRRVLGSAAPTASAAGAGFELDGTLASPREGFDLDAAFESARMKRPELKRLEMLVAAGDEGIAVARARYFPDLSASLGGELRKGGTDKLSDSLTGLRGGLRTQLEISRANRGRVAQALSQAEQLRISQAETSFAIEVQVRRAFSELGQAAELSAATRMSVGQAEESVRLATARFNAGAAVQLDVLATQVELTRARLNALSADYGHSVATAKLRAAMGRPDVDYSALGTALAGKGRP